MARSAMNEAVHLNEASIRIARQMAVPRRSWQSRVRMSPITYSQYESGTKSFLRMDLERISNISSS